MPKTSTVAAAFFEGEPLPIALVPVESNQVAAIDYDPVIKTLAVSFTRGFALYRYPGVEAETHAAFMAAESVGKFFSANFKHLPFKKFR